MNSTIRKTRSIAALLKSIHTHPKDPNNLDLATPISNLLNNGGTWDNLTTTFTSITLTHPLIETILLDLKEPTNAKKALLFFHWATHHHQFNHSLRSYCIIIHLLVRAGLLLDARALLESAIMKNPLTDTLLCTFQAAHSGPRVFDLLIQTYSKKKMIEQAFDTCRCVEDHGFSLSLISFNCMLHRAHKCNRSDLTWKIYEHMIEKRVYPNQASVEIMVNLMSKEGTLRKNVGVLDRILGKRCNPGVIVGTAAAFRIVEERKIEDAIMLLKRMLQKNMIPDGVMYSLIIYARCRRGELEIAHEVFDDMLMRGCSSNAFVYTAFVKVHCKEGRIEEASRLMEDMKSIGLKPYGETYSSMIEAWARMGRVAESMVLYGEMVRKGFVPDCDACNEMVGRLCESGEVEKADGILTVLLDRGFDANEEIYMKLIDGFGRIGKGEEMLRLYYEMKNKGIEPSMEVYALLAENLKKCGKLKEAGKFKSMVEGKM